MVLVHSLYVRTLGALTLTLVFAACGREHPVEPVAVVDNAYNVEVRFYGPEPSAAVRTAFENARARIEAMIAADLPATKLNSVNLTDNKVCGVPATINETVDDLIIYATVKTIDGVGKVQATSGPCLVRSTGKLPVVGKMEMDTDDLNLLNSSGRLDAVVLHEMLHVVGFGTIWDQVTPGRLGGAGGDDPRFVGPLAMSACVSAGGKAICATGVPVENCFGIAACGTGTRDSHWLESVFRSELMTGFIEASNVPMPLSLMTVQSFADLGYSVNTSIADAYKIPGTAVRLADEPESSPQVPWETIHRAGLEVSTDGELRRFLR